jgi:hypothetical protein
MTTLDKKSFAIFILTHGRPNEVVTFETLRKHGYTGKIVIVIDNEDKTADKYRSKFGANNVVQFDKAAIGETFDIADTGKDRRATVYARNASFQIARDLGLDYFMQFDDDYISFDYRFKDGTSLRASPIKSLNKVFEAMIDFLESSNSLTMAMAQGGDFLGGLKGTAGKNPLLRKAMNSWLFRTNRPATFVGRMNDDVNTYVMNGIRGELVFTPTTLSVIPLPTQTVSGGMTEMYLETGTYMKSMYTVMMAPSCVTVRGMGQSNRRLHHSVRWNNCTPKIISDKHRKPCPSNDPA